MKQISNNIWEQVSGIWERTEINFGDHIPVSSLGRYQVSSQLVIIMDITQSLFSGSRSGYEDKVII